MFKPSEIQAQITNQIIEALSSGKIPPWRKPWFTSAKSNSGYSCNFLSQKWYRGINVLLLSLHRERYGFESRHYATFNQWKSLKAFVQKRPENVKNGEWGCPIIYYNFVRKTEIDPVTNLEIDKSFPILKQFTVFNIEQVHGSHLDKYRANLEEIKIEQKIDFVDFEPAEKFVRGLDAEIAFGGNEAYYRPSTDSIKIPCKESFCCVEEFYQTLFHELAHWTEKRCNWSGSYAEGELRAEIAGCFLANELGVPQSNNLENHFAYLDHWLSDLRKDHKYIFRASAAASKAVDFLLGRTNCQESEEEATATA